MQNVTYARTYLRIAHPHKSVQDMYVNGHAGRYFNQAEWCVCAVTCEDKLLSPIGISYIFLADIYNLCKALIWLEIISAYNSLSTLHVFAILLSLSSMCFCFSCNSVSLSLLCLRRSSLSIPSSHNVYFSNFTPLFYMWHEPLLTEVQYSMTSINHGMNHYICLIWKCRWVVNLTLKESVRYLFYIIVCRKHDHYTSDSLVWGSLRLIPIIMFLHALHLNLLVSDCSSTDCDPLVSSIITLQVYVPLSPSIR